MLSYPFNPNDRDFTGMPTWPGSRQKNFIGKYRKLHSWKTNKQTKNLNSFNREDSAFLSKQTPDMKQEITLTRHKIVVLQADYLKGNKITLFFLLQKNATSFLIPSFAKNIHPTFHIQSLSFIPILIHHHNILLFILITFPKVPSFGILISFCLKNLDLNSWHDVPSQICKMACELRSLTYYSVFPPCLPA